LINMITHEEDLDASGLLDSVGEDVVDGQVTPADGFSPETSILASALADESHASPLIVKEVEADVASEESEVDAKPLEELGGIIVYDSQAKLVGCEKIEAYFSDESISRVMDPYILFSRPEVKEISAKCGFTEPA
jgi:hypothetical protein